MSGQIDEFFGEPISTYTDQQALEDGILVAIPGDGGVNRVTRGVFDHFVIPDDAALAVANITPLMDAIRAMLRIEPDDGWRVGEYQDRELWLIPNEVGGLTLICPEDY